MIGIHAYIDVPDLEHGIDFYCAGLGLEVRKKYSPTWIELRGADIPVFLLARKRPEIDLGATKTRIIWERHWTPVHLDFVVTDIDALAERLIRKRAVLTGAIKDREYGKIANMADPFGNGFDLIEFSGDAYAAVNRN